VSIYRTWLSTGAGFLVWGGGKMYIVMAREALQSAMRFTVGFATIVGVSAGLTVAVNHLAAQAPNNDKAVTTPAAVQTGGQDALQALSGPVSGDISDGDVIH